MFLLLGLNSCLVSHVFVSCVAFSVCLLDSCPLSVRLSSAYSSGQSGVHTSMPPLSLGQQVYEKERKKRTISPLSEHPLVHFSVQWNKEKITICSIVRSFVYFTRLPSSHSYDAAASLCNCQWEQVFLEGFLSLKFPYWPECIMLMLCFDIFLVPKCHVMCWMRICWNWLNEIVLMNAVESKFFEIDWIKLFSPNELL